MTLKKYFLIAACCNFLCGNAIAQVTCIFCYDQNAAISTPVNNLLLNGGFETGCMGGSYFCPNSNGNSCNFNDWTCTGGGILTYACALDNSIQSSIIVEGARAAYFGNYYANPCSPTINDTACLITNSDCTKSGIPSGYPTNTFSGYGGNTGVSLEQTVSGLVPGNIYVLEFWAGGESNGFNFFYDGMFAVDVGFGNIFLKCKRTPSAGFIGSRYIIEFIAASASHTFRFTNWGHICYQCTELVLDDVRLYAIAELAETVPPCMTGTSTQAEERAEIIFSNPFTNYFSVSINNPQPTQIELYDVMGRKILKQTFHRKTSINTSALAVGIYFYQITIGNRMVKKGNAVKQ
jgi:hypothetical protein